jgi:hypothetical protein
MGKTSDAHIKWRTSKQMKTLAKLFLVSSLFLGSLNLSGQESPSSTETNPTERIPDPSLRLETDKSRYIPEGAIVGYKFIEVLGKKMEVLWYHPGYNSQDYAENFENEEEEYVDLNSDGKVDMPLTDLKLWCLMKGVRLIDLNAEEKRELAELKRSLL